jgi:hypothetical protein
MFLKSVKGTLGMQGVLIPSDIDINALIPGPRVVELNSVFGLDQNEKLESILLSLSVVTHRNQKDVMGLGHHLDAKFYFRHFDRWMDPKTKEIQLQSVHIVPYESPEALSQPYVKLIATDPESQFQSAELMRFPTASEDSNLRKELMQSFRIPEIEDVDPVMAVFDFRLKSDEWENRTYFFRSLFRNISLNTREESARNWVKDLAPAYVPKVK